MQGPAVGCQVIGHTFTKHCGWGTCAGGAPQQGPVVASRQAMARWAASSMPVQRQKVQVHR